MVPSMRPAPHRNASSAASRSSRRAAAGRTSGHQVSRSHAAACIAPAQECERSTPVQLRRRARSTPSSVGVPPNGQTSVRRGDAQRAARQTDALADRKQRKRPRRCGRQFAGQHRQCGQDAEQAQRDRRASATGANQGGKVRMRWTSESSAASGAVSWPRNQRQSLSSSQSSNRRKSPRSGVGGRRPFAIEPACQQLVQFAHAAATAPAQSSQFRGVAVVIHAAARSPARSTTTTAPRRPRNRRGTGA